MDDLLTPEQTAALLTARGMTGRKGGPVLPDTVRYWLQHGQFDGALHVGGRRGLWLIPRAAVDAFVAQRLIPAE